MIDIGANLTHQSFQEDYDSVIAAACEAGLAHIIVTGTDLDSSSAAQELAEQRPDLLSCTAGFHPHVAQQVDEQSFAALVQLAQHRQVVAIGETGLDFNRNYSPPEAQIRAFERHLQLAAELNKPLFLHQRDAHEAFHALLQRYRPSLVGGVVHCFTDSESALQAYLGLDMYIGITGWICDERRGLELQGIVRQIPLDRLLVETDAPYLLPRTITPKPKSRRNEPKYLTEVVRAIAEHSDHSAQQVAEAAASNARELFALPHS